jgi:hypothetical protein
MSRKEEKKVLANFHTQPLQDSGETNTCIFANRLRVNV